jgi:hypothetical protein
LVAVKSVRGDGGIELADGRVLDASFREFLPGYAVTSYGSQGKTVDYVLFSDSTIKAATNAQQWYVTISRGRRGIRIFTPDKAAIARERHALRSSPAGAGTRCRSLRLVAAFAFGIGCTAICCASVVAPRTTSVASNSPVVVITPLKPMSTKTPECWASDPNARAVKIEVSAEQSLLLPFDQFAFAELKSEGKSNDCDWSSPRTKSACAATPCAASKPRCNQRALVPDGQPVVREIVVTEAEKQQARHPGGSE